MLETTLIPPCLPPEPSQLVRAWQVPVTPRSLHFPLWPSDGEDTVLSGSEHWERGLLCAGSAVP